MLDFGASNFDTELNQKNSICDEIKWYAIKMSSKFGALQIIRF
jgi:hypothetical protein